jgi:hypothetical protein
MIQKESRIPAVITKQLSAVWLRQIKVKLQVIGLRPYLVRPS